ncbi:MAG: prepilin-type N-terminal cleavage/methylation domain-containing protein [Gammaproteobacteria bacterium]|mgnify:FL=1|jgi:type IV fimbrial biogenesis protein FimT|nr:prepilin-type N-terminal cleavage/methylation domain-containing protein [Gammaproteobacteria bacterium]
MRKLLKSESGFTLIELMITITIGGTLLAIAMPAYQDMIKNNCMTANTNTLVANLQLARSEAIKTGQNIRVIAKGGNWSTGWTIQNPANVLIRDVDLTCGVTTITETGGDTTFFYKPSGFIDNPGTFDICDDRTAERGRQININMVGRPNTNSNFACT